MALTREQVLSSDDLPREKVPTPEWGLQLPVAERFVYVRTLTAGEREQWEGAVEATTAGARGPHIRAALVAMVACDERGNALFTPDDIPVLARKSCPVVMRLFEVAQRLSKVAPADVEALEKNSGASPSDSSASGSPGS